MNIDALILAGGFGTRIRHITGDIPKPLVKVSGKPFLHWVFHNLKRHGIRRVYLLTHFGSELIEEYVKEESNDDFKISCVKEYLPAGTGGSVLEFLSHAQDLSSPFLLLNGDSILKDFDLVEAINRLRGGCLGAIFGLPMQDASRYGTLKYDNQLLLKSFDEKKPGGGVINSGVYLFSVDLFSKIKDHKRPLSIENDVIPSMIEDGAQISVIQVESPFIDIGTEKSLHEAEQFIVKNFKAI
jgi:D-glycero-alpha-D-manno-heptose 1-phosphate guanylyltransferase